VQLHRNSCIVGELAEFHANIRLSVSSHGALKDFDGQPFTGKTVATYFGNQGAAIAAGAKAGIEILKDNHDPTA